MANTVQTIKSESLKGVTAAALGIMGFLLASLGADVLSALQSSPLPAISRTVQSKLLMLLGISKTSSHSRRYL
jgi:hypothetical protein